MAGRVVLSVKKNMTGGQYILVTAMKRLKKLMVCDIISLDSQNFLLFNLKLLCSLCVHFKWHVVYTIGELYEEDRANPWQICHC